MYRIFQDDDLIYAPNLAGHGYAVTEPILTLEINKPGTLEFTMPPTNKMFDSIELLTSTIFLFKDDDLIWHGRPMAVRENFWKHRKVTCYGALDFLRDTMWQPQSTVGRIVSAYSIVELLVTRHNTMKAAETARLITLSNDQTNTWDTMTGKRTAYWTDWVDGLTMLQSLLTDFGGYAHVSYNGSGTDIVTSTIPGETVDQTIEFGKNMLDLDRYIDAGGVYTAVVPLGERYKYSTQYTRRAERPIQVNTAGVALYGYIEKEFILEGYSAASDIDAPAAEFLQQGILGATTLDIKAVDLSVINANLDEFKAGVYVPIKSERHGLDTTVLCSKSVHHLDNPASNEYEFGSPDRRYTDQMAKRFLHTGRQINNLDDKIVLSQE